MHTGVIERFKDAVAGNADAVDLFGAAMLLAEIGGDEPDRHAYARTLDLMAEGALASVHGSGDASLVNAVDHWLFEVEGFQGNRAAYSDPENSFLNRVIETKLGIPITLSLVYLEVAERVGLQCAGIGYPGHFIVRCGDPEAPIFVDPFNQGARLDREELLAGLRGVAGLTGQPETYLAAVTKRQILQRMLHNLHASYASAGDAEHLLSVVEFLLCIEPWNTSLIAERGLLHFQLGHDQSALDDLEMVGADRLLDPHPALETALATLRTRLASNQETA